MADIDKVAASEGIQFRHFKDMDGKLVATIASAWDKNGKIAVALSMCHIAKPFWKTAKNVVNTLKSCSVNSYHAECCAGMSDLIKAVSSNFDTGSKTEGKIITFNRLKEFLGEGCCTDNMCISLTPNELICALRDRFILDYFPVPKAELAKGKPRYKFGTMIDSPRPI